MALKYDFTEGTALVRYLGGLSGDAVVTDAKKASIRTFMDSKSSTYAKYDIETLEGHDNMKDELGRFLYLDMRNFRQKHPTRYEKNSSFAAAEEIEECCQRLDIIKGKNRKRMIDTL